MPEKLNIKLLDCDRREVLKLPSGAVHLWFTLYMVENEFNESYCSTRTLAKMMNVNKDTVTKWMNYLMETGWVVNVGATAADRYSNPTPNAHQVPVVRVDDPTKRPKPSDANPTNEGSPIKPGTNQKCPNVSTVRKIRTKVVVVGCSCSGVDCTGKCDMSHVVNSPSPKETKDKTEKPKTLAAPAPPQSATRKKAAKDGTPYPPDFDSWTNLARCAWLEQHKDKSCIESESSVPVEKMDEISIAYRNALRLAALDDELE